MWLVWLVFFFVVPFFIQISHALLFFRGHSGPGYRDNEGRGSGSAGLLAAAPVEPELLASSGLLLWGGCRAATMPAEEPPPSFDLGLQSQLLAAATGLGVDAGAGEEAAACASVEELLRASSGLLDGRTRAQAEGRWRVRRRGRDGAASGPRPAPRRRRPRWPRPSPGRVEADTDAAGMRLRTMSCLAAWLRRLGSSRVSRHGRGTPRWWRRPPGGLEDAVAPVTPVTVRRTTAVHRPHHGAVPSPGARRGGRAPTAGTPRRR